MATGLRRLGQALAAVLPFAAPAVGRAQEPDANVPANDPRASTTALTLHGDLPTWQASIGDNDAFAAPVGRGIGNAVATRFIEPQHAVPRQGPGPMAWGVFPGMNVPFRL